MTESLNDDRWYADFRIELDGAFRNEFRDARWSYYFDRANLRVVAFDRPHQFDDLVQPLQDTHLKQRPVMMARKIARRLRERAGKAGYVDQRRSPRGTRS